MMKFTHQRRKHMPLALIGAVAGVVGVCAFAEPAGANQSRTRSGDVIHRGDARLHIGDVRLHFAGQPKPNPYVSYARDYGRVPGFVCPPRCDIGHRHVRRFNARQRPIIISPVVYGSYISPYDAVRQPHYYYDQYYDDARHDDPGVITRRNPRIEQQILDGTYQEPQPIEMVPLTPPPRPTQTAVMKQVTRPDGGVKTIITSVPIEDAEDRPSTSDGEAET